MAGTTPRPISGCWSTRARPTPTSAAARVADRNVIGNFTKGIDQYGPGTARTVIQGNLLCISPSGATAGCSVGIDHDFGPRDGLIGGDGPGEGNVIGPTRWEGIELSHGFDRYGDDDTAWRITRQPGHRQLGRVPHGRPLRHALPVGIPPRHRGRDRHPPVGRLPATTSSRATTWPRCSTASGCAAGRPAATQVIGQRRRGVAAGRAGAARRLGHLPQPGPARARR